MSKLVETSRAVALRRDPKPTADEPMPVINDRPAIQDLVIEDIIEDILERKREWTFKYGTPLQPFNGRSALRYLYQELLDATQYVRQLIYEEEST